MRMQAHCRLAYLEKLSKESTINFLEPTKLQEMKTRLELMDFICDGATIHCDADESAIENSLENPFIKYLFRQQKIKPNGYTAQKVSNKDSAPLSTRAIPTALFAHDTDFDSLISKQNNTGDYYFSENESPSVLFGDYIEHFSKKEVKNWDFAIDLLAPHHSLVIADPYLFNPKGITALLQLLQLIVPNKLRCTYHLTLLGSNSERHGGNNLMTIHEIRTKVNEIKLIIGKICPKIIVEYFIYNGPDFHDRYLITNNLFTFSGYGVGIINENFPKPAKEGSWVSIRPFKRINSNGKQGVFFYKVMVEKLRQLSFWIKNNNTEKIQNPLLYL